ncbi:diiron oxygenase [Saccharothrix sp. 6-C]|uniref:diiron oxygenase n=1 Tax=Saccharothrix sp. 6-C TaxID=2781735 RepID=UPI0019170231|nr:diiron oxygenase [Saccharothrix sp. 6-C]QQQ78806.1 diiron oxygenase [Saccharothrix sp. 6-C]
MSYEKPRLENIKAFDSWYDRAGVRSGPRRTFAEDADILKEFFPVHLVPHLGHPQVQQSEGPIQRYLSAQHLFQWLRFTSHFEVAVVNRATQRIAEGSSGLELPNWACLVAFQIYVDEGYHSLYSLDVLRQVEERSGIQALPYDFQRFLAKLDGVGHEYPDYRLLIQLLQVVVFETLITSILMDIPNDRSVIEVVRETVRDHAIDEGRHHAYFSNFFKYLWGQLDHGTRRLVATFLPSLIVQSLQPATRPATAALLKAGFSEAKTREIVAESYNRAGVTASIRVASAKTVALFEQLGVLDIPGSRERFVEEGLLDP